MTRQADEVGRYELKYVVPAASRDTIVDLISPHAVPDPHAGSLGDGRIGYRVHTLYLDTPDLADYFDRIAAKRVRNRVRVRTYDSPHNQPPVFLENKRKSGRWVVKHRVKVCSACDWLRHPHPRPWTQLAAQVSGAARYAASGFRQLADGGGRVPVSVVHYEREVFVPRGPDCRRVRLTLDHDVRATVAPAAHDLFAAAHVPLIPAGWMVMELKFERFAPRWMQALRARLAIVAEPVSKFGLSVARGIRTRHERELRVLTPPTLARRARDHAGAA